MPDTVKIGAGSSVAFSATVGGSYTTIVKVQAITPNKISVAKVAVDAFDNATFNGNPVEDCIPGWVAPGTYTFKLYFLKTQHAALRALVGVDPQYFKVIKADGSGYILQGFISEMGEETPMKEAMMADFTVQIKGGIATFNTSQS